MCIVFEEFFLFITAHIPVIFTSCFFISQPISVNTEFSCGEIELTKNLGKSLLNVNLTGGEPFARKDITEIAKLYIKNTNIQSIYVTTNASLPDRVENFARTIIDFDKNIELTFQISIDDMPEAHNRVRKISNLFESCIDTYQRLQKIDKRVNAIVSITVNHENCENIEKIFEYLTVECKVNSIKCTIVRDVGFIKPQTIKSKKYFKLIHG